MDRRKRAAIPRYRQPRAPTVPSRWLARESTVMGWHCPKRSAPALGVGSVVAEAALAAALAEAEAEAEAGASVAAWAAGWARAADGALPRRPEKRSRPRRCRHSPRRPVHRTWR